MKTRSSCLIVSVTAATVFFALSVNADETATNSAAVTPETVTNSAPALAPPAGLQLIETSREGFTNATPTAAPKMSAVTNQIALKFVKVDSEETAGEDGKGANAVDGNPNTFWHTQWQDASPEHPHEIIIELVPPSTIKGFTYLPRQDDNENGTIKDYEFYVSDDGNEFGQPIKKGALETGSDKKTVTFDPVNCRFIKLKAVSEVNGEAWTSAAEIGVIPND
jgi:F5/8 type C domain